MGHLAHIKKIAAGIGVVTALTAMTIVPAMAIDEVTQEVTGGGRSASVGDMALGSVAYSHVAQAGTGTMTLTADDSTGSGAGWNVTILTSDFVYGGSAGGASDIPAANFSLTSAAVPVATAGQAVSGTDGPMVPTISPVGTLDEARKVEQANAGFGAGTYTQALDVSLAIPAQTRAGTYTGTLVTSINAAP